MDALPTNTNTQIENELEDDEFHKLQKSLPKDEWFNYPMSLYQGFWCPDLIFEGVTAFQTNFEANDSDIILAALPKTGTTWLKSLLFAITNREKLSPNDFSQHPFHTKNPHQIILQFEFDIYKNIRGIQPNLSEIPSPRIFGTHVPYQSLPESIKTSKCKIVYICRNPFDTFVSAWHFFLKHDLGKELKPNKELMEKYVGKFCEGLFPFGPYEDHLLGYFKESMQNSQKVLFLEYEGLKKDPKIHFKRLAEFVGYSFSEEEEKGSVIDEIIELCSLKSMKELEVNKNGQYVPAFKNNAFFRKGEVGDWRNHLTPSMAKKIENMQEKLIKFGYCSSYCHGRKN